MQRAAPREPSMLGLSQPAMKRLLTAGAAVAAVAVLAACAPVETSGMPQVAVTSSSSAAPTDSAPTESAPTDSSPTTDSAPTDSAPIPTTPGPITDAGTPTESQPGSVKIDRRTYLTLQRANFPAFWPDSQLIKMADVICHSFDNGLDFYTLAKDLESTVRGGQQGRPYHAGAAIATAVLWRCPNHTGRLPGH